MPLKKIFFVGSEGIIGKHIAPLLDEHEVTRYDLVFGQDTRDKECLEESTPKVIDFVFHLANIPRPQPKLPVELFKEINVGGTKNLLAVLKKRKVGGIVFFSSLAAIGWDVYEKRWEADFSASDIGDWPAGKPPWDEKVKALPPNGWEIESYGASKTAQEKLLRESTYNWLGLRLGPFGKPLPDRSDYYNDSVSAEYVIPVVRRILERGMGKSGIIHVCRPGLFGGQKLQRFISG